MTTAARRVAALTAFLAAAFLWFGARAAQNHALGLRADWGAEDDFVLVPPPSAAPLLYGGYNELWADITWVRTLVYYGSAKIGKSDFRYLERLIDNILALDPKFHKVYEWAAAAVTYRDSMATQEEFKTSVGYLRRGIEQFPDDYDLYEALVMKLWWDLAPSDPAEVRKNRVEAARLAEFAMRLPKAPPAAATRIAVMWSDLGELEHARETLRQMLLTTENKEARAKMIARFREIATTSNEAELLAAAKRDFDRQYEETLPWGPSDLFVLLGPRPAKALTIDELTGGTLLGRVELLESGPEADPSDETTKIEPSP